MTKEALEKLSIQQSKDIATLMAQLQAQQLELKKGYDKPKLGEGTFWPSNDASKTHIGTSVIEVELKHPVTGETHRYDLRAVLYDTWPFSNKKMTSKNGKQGLRIWMTQERDQAATGDTTAGETVGEVGDQPERNETMKVSK